MSEIARRDAAPEVLPSLLELAVIANEEHALCERILGPALQSALPHAIAAGEALLAARQQTPTGSWRRWLSENFDASYAAANRYVRIAQYKHLLTGARGVKDALEQLAGLPDAASRAGASRLYGEDVRDAALRDRRAGKTIHEVADKYEVSPTTVWRWEHPGQQAAIRRRWYAKRKARLQAAERLEQARAARKINTPLAEAYAMAERMQDVLVQAQRETADSETRAALRDAGEHYRKMRDEIVRALGAGS
jgi:DNA-binding transcriptional MerR regulator